MSDAKPIDGRFWGSLLISILITMMFGAVVTGLVQPPDADVKAAITAAFTWVVGYWIGSSSSSTAKDVALRSANAALSGLLTTPPKEGKDANSQQ